MSNNFLLNIIDLVTPLCGITHSSGALRHEKQCRVLPDASHHSGMTSGNEITYSSVMLWISS